MKDCDFCGSKFAERKCYFCDKRCCTSCMIDDKSRCKQCYIQKRTLGWRVIKKNKVMLGFIGMGGPAVALWVMCQPWDSKQSRGFLFAMLFYGMIPLAIMLVWQFGATSMTGLILGILGLPVVFMGTEIGIRVGNKLDRKKLQHYALAALFLIGMSAILKPYLMG